MKIQTQALHFKADTHLLSFVEKKMKKLERFFEEIIDANIVLKLGNNTGKVRDKVAEVKINLPGCVLYVKETSKTFEASVDGAIVALNNQLARHKNRMRNRR